MQFSPAFSYFALTLIYFSSHSARRDQPDNIPVRCPQVYFTVSCCAHIFLAVRFLKCENIIITQVTFQCGIVCITLLQVLSSYSSIFYFSCVPQTCYLSTDVLHKKSTVPWNVTPCRLKEKCRRFGKCSVSIFYYGDGLNRFLRNASSYLPKYTAWHSLIQQFTQRRGNLILYIFTVAWRLLGINSLHF